MKNKFLVLATILSFLLILGASQVYADSLVVDTDPPDSFIITNNVNYSPDTNPMLFNPDDPGSEQAFLEALLGFNVDYLGKDSSNYNDGNWSDEGTAVPWTYAVLKFGQGQPVDFDHIAIMDDPDDDLVDASFLTYSTLGLSHITYFGGSPSVPEPATMLLLGSGLIGLAAFGRRKFK